jgi:hypothetical protein
MRKLSILGVVLGALLVPAAASAQLTLGARLGYAIAGGDAVKDGKMTDVIKGDIPIQLDVGYNLTKELNVGAFFSYGFGMLNSDIKDECDAAVPSVSCSTHNMRIGIQGTFAFEDLNPQFVPWIGFGVGYEWATLKVEQGGEKVTDTFKGFELANLQLGADFKASPQLRFGPFISYSFGQFRSETVDPDPLDLSGDITDKGTHTYLTFGVRGQFGM